MYVHISMCSAPMCVHVYAYASGHHKTTSAVVLRQQKFLAFFGCSYILVKIKINGHKWEHTLGV